jgi:hypothetical protein
MTEAPSGAAPFASLSRPAHHPPQARTQAAITEANPAATTHRSASSLGKNGSLTAIANHKEPPKIIAEITPVTSHLAARLTQPTSALPRAWKP